MPELAKNSGASHRNTSTPGCSTIWSPRLSLCQPSRPDTRPSTSPCGHQFRWKNSRIDSTTATRMPSRTPRKITPALATTESATADRRTFHTRARNAKSASDNAAAITTAASAEFGRSASTPLKNSNSRTTKPAPTIPASCVLAPDCSATAVRELLADTAKPWNRPAARLADPIPIISWFGFTSSPRLALNEVDSAMVSVSETSVMPTAATSSGTTSPNSVQGSGRPGEPFGKGADGADVEVEDGGGHGGADHGHQHGRHLARQARQQEQYGEGGQAHREGGGVAPVEVRHELPHLVHEVVGVRREAAQLGELPDDDGDGEAVHVADLDLARQQVGHESELADTETDLDQAHEDRQHPGQGDGGRRVVARHHERGDGGEDQRAE